MENQSRPLILIAKLCQPRRKAKELGLIRFRAVRGFIHESHQYVIVFFTRMTIKYCYRYYSGALGAEID